MLQRKVSLNESLQEYKLMISVQYNYVWNEKTSGNFSSRKPFYRNFQKQKQN